MPSSHASFLALFFLSLSLSLSYGIGPLPRQRAIPTNPSHCRRMLSPLLSLSPLTLSLAAIVAASRICLNYRTPIQVTLGCRAGTVSAVVSFAVTEWARRSAWAERLWNSLVSMMGR